jgi:hypothetical protein
MKQVRKYTCWFCCGPVTRTGRCLCLGARALGSAILFPSMGSPLGILISKAPLHQWCREEHSLPASEVFSTCVRKSYYIWRSAFSRKCVSTLPSVVYLPHLTGCYLWPPMVMRVSQCTPMHICTQWFCVCVCVWCWSLNSGPTPWAIPLALFCVGYFCKKNHLSITVYVTLLDYL